MGKARGAGRAGGGLRAVLAACWLALTGLPSAVLADGVLTGRTVVVDPGHGGIDGGATAFGRLEKNITLPIGLDLGAMLRGRGARVVFTRSDDSTVSLAARTTLANAVGASAFVAIHANALNDPAFHGLMTFYGPPSGYVTGVRRGAALVAASQALAQDVQAAALRQTGARDQGVQTADYYVLGNAGMPAVLIETGFVTNPGEGAALATPGYQQAVAAGIAGGIGQFFSGSPADITLTPRDVTATPLLPAGSYVVRAGDTLSGIALRLAVPETLLARANGITNTDAIVAGRTLVIAAPGRGASTADAAAPAPSASTASSSQGSAAYTVRPGDTLSALALRFHVSQMALADANRLRRPDALLAGQALRLPFPVAVGNRAGERASAGAAPYIVRPGDTISAIAARFGIGEAALAQANGLRNLDHVLAGQALHIPAA